MLPLSRWGLVVPLPLPSPPLLFCFLHLSPQVPSSTSFLSHSKPEVGGNSTAQVVYICSCPLPRPGFGSGGGRHGGVLHEVLSSLSPTPLNPRKELLDLAKSGRRSQICLSLQIFAALAKAASSTCKCFPTWLCGSRHPPPPSRVRRECLCMQTESQRRSRYAPKQVKTPGKGNNVLTPGSENPAQSRFS